ncbi:VOC family protein [Amycolatopsis sp. NPDC051071]|uniref:VOC family protein n=1 Tax=Amycolatopsis sp. NPDC051071 TaxID=3154637 RepID=UPI0034347637
MQLSGFGACVVVDDIAATTAWWKRHLHLTVTIELDWFSSLNVGVPGYEMSFVKRGHHSTPEPWRTQESAGSMVGLMVTDAAAEYERLVEEGVKTVTELVDEEFGQRHFYVEDLNGFLIDIIEPIPPSPEWLAANGLA